MSTEPLQPPRSPLAADHAPTRLGAHAPSRLESHTQRVQVKRKALEAYRRIIGDEELARIRELATDLHGARILEVSSTATGGGVAELLSSLVPLQRDLGLEAQWDVIPGDARFFAFTKALHNGLQGMEVELPQADQEEYVRQNVAYAGSLEDSWDIIIVHDPQPAAMRALAREPQTTRWIWRCHVDSSTPNPEAWRFLRPYVERYDRAIFTLPQFVPTELSVPVTFIAPAIDPISSKNRELPAYLSRETVAELGIDVARPLMLQVSRFDPWKDPLGVIEVWRKVRDTFGDLQLALVGAMASDDPEAWRLYQQLEAEVAGERDCFLLTNQMGVTAHEVNALQRVADVAIQKSIREGFGLVVSETLWKETAMLAGHVGGIPTQLQNGIDGLLATEVEEFAEYACQLLESPSYARELGVAGRARVCEEFLITRLLADQLLLFAEELRA